LKIPKGEPFFSRWKNHGIANKESIKHNMLILFVFVLGNKNSTKRGDAMGLWDLFTNKKPTLEAINKQVQRAKEHYAQPDYRRMAMDQLLKWDTQESLRGLLDRFCVVVQSPHWDEEEKKWLSEQIVALGDKMKPILRDFILEKNEINHALGAYRQICKSDEEYSALIIEALKKRPPSDHRSVQGKQELLAALHELNSPALEEIIAPYLNDHSDDVQFLSIEALATSESPEIRKLLVNMLGSESHSARVVRAAALVVSQQKIHVEPDLTLSEAVSEDYKIDQGLLHRR